MTPFHFECGFRGEIADYWRAFFDDECAREQYDLIGVREFKVLDRHDDGETLVRSVRVNPKRDIPGFMRKIFGTSLGFVETTTFYRSQGYAETKVVSDLLTKRTRIGGTHRVRELPSGKLVRVFEGHVGIDVPLVGRRIEKFIIADIDKSYAKSTEITQLWLDRWTLES